MPDSENTEDLQPSRLGTKEYWDDIYEREMTNFDEFGDEGEVWFGRESVDKMVSWALANVPPSSSPSSSVHPPTRVLEIGCGNGNLLFALSDAGYDALYLAGIDYSGDAVRLARRIANEKGEVDGQGKIVFEEVDFLGLEGNVRERMPRVHAERETDEKEERRGWTLVLDKGTYDAMALAERDGSGKRPCDVYPERVAALLEPGGFFLITSCNLTHEGLLRTFEKGNTGLKYHSEIEFPSISFGGAQGSTYRSIAFQKTRTTTAH